MADIFRIILSIKFFLREAWPMRINKRRNAGSPGSDMKESTALLQFTLIGTPVDSMAKRFA